MAGIDSMFTSIKDLFQRPKAMKVPPQLAAAAELRCGISKATVKSNIISKLSQAGFNVEDMPSGEKNKLVEEVSIIVDCIMEEIIMNSIVQTTSAPGALIITGTGANAGGAVQVEGINVNFPPQTGFIV